MTLTKEMKRIAGQTAEEVVASGATTYYRYKHTILDATEPFTLKVTPEHVRKGTPGKADACAIAQSALGKGVKGVGVGMKFAYVSFENDVALRFVLPSDARRLRRAFDAGRDVFLDPAGYRVTLEPPSIDKIGDRVGEPHGSTTRKGLTNQAIRAAAGRKITSL